MGGGEPLPQPVTAKGKLLLCARAERCAGVQETAARSQGATRAAGRMCREREKSGQRCAAGAVAARGQAWAKWVLTVVGSSDSREQTHSALAWRQ